MAEAALEIKMEQSADSICRLCFTESDNYRQIFVDEYSSLPEWIEKLTSLKVEKLPNAPATLCLECEKTLKNFDSFREMCFTNDRVIKEMFIENDSRHNNTADLGSRLESTNEIKTELCKDQGTDFLYFTVESLEDSDIKIEQDDSENQLIEVSNSSIDFQDENTDCQDIKFEVDSSVDSEDYGDEMKDSDEVHEQVESDSFVEIGTEGKRRHVCSFCHKDCMNANRLKIHILSHTQERSYKCGICGKPFITLSNMKRHLISHSGLRPYECDLCPAKFSQSSHLKRHKIAHLKKNQMSTTNSVDKNDSNRGMEASDKNHSNLEQMQDNGKMKKLCPVCNKYYFKLKDHMVIHDEIRPYQCQYCPKGFNQIYKLTVHTRAHNNDKPFMCNYCGKGFTNAGDLKIHIRTHSQEKPFNCKECHKSFISVSHLARHKLTHSGVKPHSCDICQAKFSQSGHLQRHKQSVHKTTTMTANANV